MKKKTLPAQKLKLEKTVIAPLTNKEMQQARGGLATVRTHGSGALDCTSRETTGYNTAVEDQTNPIIATV